MQPPPEDDAPIDRLRSIMAALRGPDGCPWDREQTLDSLKRYAVEEVYEVLEAIDSGDPKAHCDELGDLLLQVVFQAQLRDEEGAFTFDDVASAISEKLIRRHPHVFGDVVADDPDTVVRNWEAIKEQEKGDNETPVSRMDKLPLAQPALMVAREAQSRAAKDGFDWPEVDGAFDKLREEVSELEAALAEADPDAVTEELGDILFTVVNLARHVKVEPEVALHEATRKFARRYRIMEGYAQAAGTTMEECTLARLESWWQRSKTEST